MKGTGCMAPFKAMGAGLSVMISLATPPTYPVSSAVVMIPQSYPENYSFFFNGKVKAPDDTGQVAYHTDIKILI